MSGDPIGPMRHGVHLFASVDRVPVGRPFTVAWRTSCWGVAVARSHLTTAGQHGLESVEAVSDRGLRQVIHAHPDVITFTLAVTFDDGVKRWASTQVRVYD